MEVKTPQARKEHKEKKELQEYIHTQDFFLNQKEEEKEKKKNKES